MKASRVLSATLSWTIAGAFVPSLNLPLLSSAPCVSLKEEKTCITSVAEGKERDLTSLKGVPYQDSGSNTRTTAPVVLVGSDEAVLEAFAEHVVEDRSHVVNLRDIAEAEGSQGVERVLTSGNINDVLIIHAGTFSGQPEVTALIRKHVLTVQLALPGEDQVTRVRCEQATKYTVVIGADNMSTAINDDTYNDAKDDLTRLMEFARSPKRSREDVQLDMGINTFFLSLTFDDLRPHASLLPELTEGVDAMELRVDLLANQDPYHVLHQLSVLRRYTSNLPVVFTVRSKSQCGAFPDDPGALFRLARWGLRAGVEVMDVEANWPSTYRHDFINEAKESYPSTMLVGSYHVVGRKTSEDQARALFMECYHDGAVDAVKVVTTAYEPDDSLRVHAVARSLSLPVPYIALCLTEQGKLSRVLNERFTPVTHEKLPFVAAPGQLSSAQIMRHRAELGLCPSRSFFLFGFPISASPSPDMHNAGFHQCGLPYKYSLWESEDPSVMAEALARSDFGGASVTIPHKQNILPFLNEVSIAAERIGAVNTVIVSMDPETGDRVLRGDNTDWLGILRPIKAKLEAAGWQEGQGGVALVVGAGGAAMGALFAMQQMGLQLVVYNRTPSKAEKLAERFGGAAISRLDVDALKQACGQTAVDVVVSTIPASSQFTLPGELLKSKPVVFDAAYKPALTALLSQAKDADCPYIQGADMLVEQGLEQFHLWTQRRSPRRVMENAVYRTVERV